MSEFEPTLGRFLPRGSADERDVEDLEGYIRATVRWAMPHVTDRDETADLVAQGFLIAENIQRETELNESFRQALAARLANQLRSYWREQHPEVRRNTRAAQRAAERGEEYRPKVYQATGLAPEIDAAWDRETLAPQSDVTAEVYDRLKLEELEGITSARDLMLDPQKAGLLFDVASHRPLTPARAKWAFDDLQDRRLEQRLRGFGFMRNL
jgi:hypothetical protein